MLRGERLEHAHLWVGRVRSLEEERLKVYSRKDMMEHGPHESGK